MDFLKQQFDKLLLAALFIIAAIMTVVLMHWNMDTSMITWSQGLTTGFVGALLTLITGSRFTARASDRPPGEK